MKTLNQDLKSGEFKKTYLLYGDEAYLRRYYLKAFREAVLHGDGMNLLQLEGKEPPLDRLRDFTDTMPFFSEHRLVILSDTGLFKGASEGYDGWLSGLPDTAVVIFSESEVDKRNRLYKKIAVTGYAAELSAPDEKGRGAYIQSVIKKNGLQITRNAYELLLTRLTGSLDQTVSELEKLAAYAGESKSVSEEDVRNIITESTEIRIFDLTDAVSEGNIKKAFDIYYALIREKEPAMRILFLISRQFSQLFSVQEMSREGISPDEISKILAIRSPYVVKRLQRTAGGFQRERLKRAMSLLAETEEAVKTGNLNEAPAVEMLMIRLCER